MQGSASAREEWRRNWTLVLAAAIGVSMSSLATQSIGAFITPLEQAFGWTRAKIASGITVYAFVSIFTSALAGVLVDRFGPRRIAVPATLVTGIGIALFSTTTGSLFHWLLLWALFGIYSQMIDMVTWTASVSTQFSKGRGLALSMTLAGSALSAFGGSVYSSYLIDAFGWRLAYVVLGLSWGTFAFVLTYFFFSCSADVVRDARAKRAPLPGVSLRDALTSVTFAKLAAALFIGHMLIIGSVVHLIPLLSGTGLTRSAATWIVGCIGFASIAGKLTCGLLVTRFDGNYIAAGIVSLPIIAYAMLLVPSDSVAMRMIPVAIIGFGIGSQVHMRAYLTTRYFGMKSFGTIFGLQASIISVAVGIGPLLVGHVFDQAQSYDPVLIAGIPMSIIAALLMLSLGRYPDEPETAQATEPIGTGRPAVAT